MTDTTEELERLLAGYGRKEVADIDLWDALKDAAPSLLASLKAVTAERDALKVELVKARLLENKARKERDAMAEERNLLMIDLLFIGGTHEANLDWAREVDGFVPEDEDGVMDAAARQRTQYWRDRLAEKRKALESSK